MLCFDLLHESEVSFGVILLLKVARNCYVQFIVLTKASPRIVYSLWFEIGLVIHFTESVFLFLYWYLCRFWFISVFFSIWHSSKETSSTSEVNVDDSLIIKYIAFQADESRPNRLTLWLWVDKWQFCHDQVKETSACFNICSIHAVKCPHRCGKAITEISHKSVKIYLRIWDLCP